MWQVSTVIWGSALILDAALRVAMAYTLPPDVVPGLAGSLWLVTFLTLQVSTNVYFARAGLWQTLAEANQDDQRQTRTAQTREGTRE